MTTLDTLVSLAPWFLLAFTCMLALVEPLRRMLEIDAGEVEHRSIMIDLEKIEVYRARKSEPTNRPMLARSNMRGEDLLFALLGRATVIGS